VKKILLFLLLLTWAGIGSAWVYLKRTGGFYSYTQPVGSLNGQPVPTYSLLQVYALTRPENVSEVIFREMVGQKAREAGVTYDPTSRRTVMLSLAKTLHKSLPAQDLARLEKAQVEEEVDELEVLPCKPEEVDYIRSGLSDFSLADIAIRNGRLGSIRVESLGLNEIERNYGQSARSAVSRLKPGGNCGPVRIPGGMLFFHLIGRSRIQGDPDEFLLRTFGWKQIEAWMGKASVQFANYQYDPEVMKRVYQSYFYALAGAGESLQHK